MASEESTTKVGVFETGTKDNFGASYKDDRLLFFRNKDLTRLEVKEGTKIICDRWGFIGEEIKGSPYMNKDARGIVEFGSGNPVKYINC